MRPDVSHRHRLGGLLPLLDDHDRAQSSSASRVTAGASGFFALTQSRILDTHGIGERSEIFQIPNRLNQFIDGTCYIVGDILEAIGISVLGGHTFQRSVSFEHTARGPTRAYMTKASICQYFGRPVII